MKTRNIPWAVSHSDVQKHPGYADGQTLHSILYSLGMDVKKGFADDERWKLEPDMESEESESEFDYYHTNFAGERVKCRRWVGVARQDGKWRRFVSNYLELPIE